MKKNDSDHVISFFKLHIFILYSYVSQQTSVMTPFIDTDILTMIAEHLILMHYWDTAKSFRLVDRKSSSMLEKELFEVVFFTDEHMRSPDIDSLQCIAMKGMTQMIVLNTSIGCDLLPLLNLFHSVKVLEFHRCTFQENFDVFVIMIPIYKAIYFTSSFNCQSNIPQLLHRQTALQFLDIRPPAELVTLDHAKKRLHELGWLLFGNSEYRTDHCEARLYIRDETIARFVAEKLSVNGRPLMSLKLNRTPLRWMVNYIDNRTWKNCVKLSVAMDSMFMLFWS